jgi:hypothetical protein
MTTNLIWGNLLQLSCNMWTDRPDPKAYWPGKPQMDFQKRTWDDITQRMAQAGMNMLVIDLGDGVKYQSHPEIALPDAWSTDELRKELARLRGLGIEPIPKLNFSTAHDLWLKEYGRMVSSKIYYEVCSHLIEEVVDLFDRPRFFHLGMDEETAELQRLYAYCVVRQHELLWHDLRFFVNQVERHHVRAWIWSDLIWDHEEAFLANVPKTVLQSNWYYFNEFDQPTVQNRDRHGPAAYRILEEHGYDQLPTGSNWATPENFGLTVDYCSKIIAPERLQGFLMTLGSRPPNSGVVTRWPRFTL